MDEQKQAEIASLQQSLKSDPVGLVDYITRNMVKNPDDVDITSVMGSNNLNIELRVCKEDLGTVIGRGGRIAKSVRNLLNSISYRKYINDQVELQSYRNLNLEIIDE